jgi:hypothetical protein
MFTVPGEGRGSWTAYPGSMENCGIELITFLACSTSERGRTASIQLCRCAAPHCSAGALTRCENEFVSGPDSTTRIQSQLLSVGFVVSGLSPRHVGLRVVLRVPRRPRRAENPADSTPFRFRSALCSQKITENCAHLAHAERVSGRWVMRVSGRAVWQPNWCRKAKQMKFRWTERASRTSTLWIVFEVAHQSKAFRHVTRRPDLLSPPLMIDLIGCSRASTTRQFVFLDLGGLCYILSGRLDRRSCSYVFGGSYLAPCAQSLNRSRSSSGRASTKSTSSGYVSVRK